MMPPGGLSAELRAELKSHKLDLVELISQPETAVRDLWGAAVGEISAAWDTNASDRRGQGIEPLWLDETLDQRLQENIAEAIRAADLPRALSAIDHWRLTWLELLGNAPEDRGWFEIASDVLGEHVVVALRPGTVKVAKAARPNLVFYAPVEVDRLHGTKDPSLIRAVHHTKKVLGGVVQDPGLADGILAEVDGRVRRKNPCVHDMLEEAKARFEAWTSNEKSLTSWLRKNAPSDAAWIDWRQKTGADHMATLDRAFEPVTGTPIMPQESCGRE